ncbi:AT-rich interactive domain-containing protein 6-like isoform X2 [Rhodamnia argentea]|uniref:AT-rich interactive domain-containing protein 6-like isoform X2 n=1 Tax=Rhodamnia argentea TaxID=178133 RepID=A0ABM3GW70_9MYRT|nr:AT-rich interactive domain-containing protein 6-like isoform X2 [Rhodamnia argentea]
MSGSKENEEMDKEVPPGPAPNLVDEGLPNEVQVEASHEQSPHSAPAEETLKPIENVHTLPLEDASTDDKKVEPVSGTPLSAPDSIAITENQQDVPECDNGSAESVAAAKDEIQKEATDLLQKDATCLPKEEAADLPQEEATDLSLEETKGDSTTLPQKEATELPLQETNVDSITLAQKEATDLPLQDTKVDPTALSTGHPEPVEPILEAKAKDTEMVDSKMGAVCDDLSSVGKDHIVAPNEASIGTNAEIEKVEPMKVEEHQTETPVAKDNGNSSLKHLFLLDENDEGSESGTEEDQSLFMKELESFFRERSMEFKPPKFYGEGLNCLKLWRAVTRLGGYDKVTSCKLWRQVGESFRPPKTCTTVSWTFRGFYEKALLDYERHNMRGGELSIIAASPTEPMVGDNQASGSGRAPRDAAARARQGWHSQRLLGNGEVSDPIIKDKNAMSTQKREKQLKSVGPVKRKKQPYLESSIKATRPKTSKSQLDIPVVDIGPPADWVKINVQKTKDCFEVYALVPGLLREEVRVQSDPAGRLVISGEPEQPDNPWGVTPFKKIVNLPSRIDPHQTSAVVTLHGQLFVRVPFEQSE